MSNKPREFVLGHLEAKDNDGNDYFVVTKADPKVSFRDIVDGNIHVVEYGAYEKLLEEHTELIGAYDAMETALTAFNDEQDEKIEALRKERDEWKVTAFGAEKGVRQEVEKLRAENEKLLKDREINWAQWNYTELKEENDKLKADLKLAVEALEYIEHLYVHNLSLKGCDRRMWSRAQSALAKLQSNKGEEK